MHHHKHRYTAIDNSPSVTMANTSSRHHKRGGGITNPSYSRNYVAAAAATESAAATAAAPSRSMDPVESKKGRHPSGHGKAALKSQKNSFATQLSGDEGGVSEVSSSDRNSGSLQRGSSQCATISPSPIPSHHNSSAYPAAYSSPMTSGGQLVASGAALQPLSSAVPHHYASVNFRFGSAWFIAPFRCQAGDIVVVEYPAAQSLHMGIVSGVTTVKPPTFYSEQNMTPDYLSEEELAILPRLLRHARHYDKQAKLALREQDMRSLEHAQFLAAEMNAPVTFMDAEWLLDGSAITFLVYVYGDVALVNELADELATREGAEVVFTYPS